MKREYDEKRQCTTYWYSVEDIIKYAEDKEWIINKPMKWNWIGIAKQVFDAYIQAHHIDTDDHYNSIESHEFEIYLYDMATPEVAYIYHHDYQYTDLTEDVEYQDYESVVVQAREWQGVVTHLYTEKSDGIDNPDLHSVVWVKIDQHSPVYRGIGTYIKD